MPDYELSVLLDFLLSSAFIATHCLESNSLLPLNTTPCPPFFITDSMLYGNSFEVDKSINTIKLVKNKQ